MRASILVLSCIWLCGCTVGSHAGRRGRQGNAHASSVEAQLLEAYALDTIGCKEEHILLQLETSTGKTLSPSAMILKALREKGHSVVERSRVRFPRQFEKAPTDSRRLRGLELRGTGLGVVEYHFRVVKVLGGNRFIIKYDMYGGPLYGGGSEQEVEFLDGRIIVHKRINDYIS